MVITGYAGGSAVLGQKGGNMVCPIDICNQALFHLGVSGISDLDDTGDISAVACKMFYDAALRTALRDHPWGFAKTEVALSLAAESGEYPSYDYAYQYPHDCLRPLRIHTDDRKKSRKIEYDVQINLARNGKVILTDEPEAILSYIVYIDDPNLYDGWFVEMFVLCLASKIAGKLTGDTTKSKNMLSAYMQARDQAQAIAGNENYEEQVFYNDFLQARG